MTRLRARCPHCHREMAVRTPRGGDGSADVFPAHTADKGRRGPLCAGSFGIVQREQYRD